MKLKKLIKELDDEYFYLSLYIDGKRVYGDFCYNQDTTLKSYLNCEVLDIEPSENSKIVKVKLEKCITQEEVISEPILEEKEEKSKNGNKRRNTTSKKGSRLS